MYTSFVSDTRKAITSCWNSVKDIQQKQTQNNTVYQQDYADSENAKLEQQKKDACAAATEKINGICDKASDDAARLDMIIPLDLDERNNQRILTLLSGAFTLNVDQLQHLIDEYIGKGDYTLQNAVSTYCELRGMKLIHATTESRRSAIREIRESALSLVSRIESANYRNFGMENDIPLLVSAFCTDNNFSAELCQRLGQTFSGDLLSPKVELAEPFDFHFQSVNGKKQN